MKKKLIIFGNGEIAEIANYYFNNQTNYLVSYFAVDKEFIKDDNFCKKPIVPFQEIEKKFTPDEYEFHVAISYQKLNQLREKKYNEAKMKKYKLASFISKNSHCNLDEITFGDNCFILENQTIQNGVKIGNNVMIWSSNHIGHMTEIGDHTYISSHVVISGHCKIGSRCFFGVNSAVADFSKIEDDCFIGMSANVNRNLNKSTLAVNKSTDFYEEEHRLNKIIKKKFFKF
tara:strand:+ start:264 stop:953 length:690 start_codon:yes stop_codon:yes gene_type:complete